MKKLKMKKLISLLLTLTMILALTACGAKETGKSQDESDLNYVKSKGKLIIGYTNYAPMNYLHKFYLVEAEQCRVKEQYLEAIDYYDRSISLAKENGYTNEDSNV